MIRNSNRLGGIHLAAVPKVGFAIAQVFVTARYQEFIGDLFPVTVRIVALPREMRSSHVDAHGVFQVFTTQVDGRGRSDRAENRNCDEYTE